MEETSVRGGDILSYQTPKNMDSSSNILGDIEITSQKSRQDQLEDDEFETAEENYYDKKDFDLRESKPNKIGIFQEK